MWHNGSKGESLVKFLLNSSSKSYTLSTTVNDETSIAMPGKFAYNMTPSIVTYDCRVFITLDTNAAPCWYIDEVQEHCRRI